MLKEKDKVVSRISTNPELSVIQIRGDPTNPDSIRPNSALILFSSESDSR